MKTIQTLFSYVLLLSALLGLSSLASAQETKTAPPRIERTFTVGKASLSKIGGYLPTAKLSFTWPRSMAQIPINVEDANDDRIFKCGLD